MADSKEKNEILEFFKDLSAFFIKDFLEELRLIDPLKR